MNYTTKGYRLAQSVPGKVTNHLLLKTYEKKPSTLDMPLAANNSLWVRAGICCYYQKLWEQYLLVKSEPTVRCFIIAAAIIVISESSTMQ